MVTKRIIPCLDVRNGRVVKGVNFLDVQDVSDPVRLADYYSRSGADELVFYDITASVEGRKLFTDILTDEMCIRDRVKTRFPVCMTAYGEARLIFRGLFQSFRVSSSISSRSWPNRSSAAWMGWGEAISTPAPRSRSMGSWLHPPDRKPR